MIQLFQVIETIHNMYLIMELAGGGQLQWHVPEACGIQKIHRVRQPIRENGPCHLLTRVEVAVNVLRKKEEDKSLLCERDSLKVLEHPSVIHLFQVMETMDNMYLIMECAHGRELLSHIPLTCGIREVKVRRLFREMVLVLQYCHQKGVVHLDLKPKNFMVDSRVRHPKLIDFGLSTSFTPGQKLDGKKDHSGCSPIGARSLIQQILVVDPMEKPTLEQVMGYPVADPGRGLLIQPSQPSQPATPQAARPPSIMTLMLNMGYNPYKARLSLANRQFDGAMATYFLLQHQRIQGPASALWAKAVHNGMAGHRQVPGADPSSIHPNKCPSEPALALPCEQQPPDKATPSGQKGTAYASMSVCPLHLLHVKTPPSKPASQQDPLASQGGSTGQPGERSRGWRGVTRQLATFLQQLCCCLPCFRGPAFRNRVAPSGAGHRPHRFHNRVAPGNMPT
ncbi:sperm motility kinase 2B-like [Urocitellus parryii]